MFADTILSTLFPFYNIILRVNAVFLGAVMTLPRLYDAITDPLMGQISDKTRSRWGRRRPYIAVGAVFVALVTLLMWNPPALFSPRQLGAYLLVIMFLAATATTVTIVPYYSLGAEMSTDYDERSRIVAYRAVFTRIGAATGNLAFWFAHLKMFSTAREGFQTVGVILATVAVVAFWLVAATARENAARPRQHHMGFLKGVGACFSNVPFVLLAVSAMLFITGLFSGLPLAAYINIYYVYGGDEQAASTLVSWYGFTWHASGCLFIPLIAWMSTRMGKHATFSMGLLCFALIFLTSWFFFNPAYPFVQLVLAVLLGFGLASFLVLPTSMVADVCDFDALKTGQRREGVYFGFFTFLFKAGFSFTSLLNGLCLQWAGFDENLSAQAPETVLKLRLMLMLIPAVGVGLAGLVMMWYPLDKERVEEMRAVLDARQADSSRNAHMDDS